MKKVLKSVTHARRGLQKTWSEERNFRIGTGLAFLVLLTAILVGMSLASIALLFTMFSVLLVAEGVNTAIENVCNRIAEHHDESIKNIKDISAGFVLLALIAAGILTVALFVQHFVS